MLIRRLSRILSAALALTSVSLFAASAYGQAQGSKPGGLESEVADVKAENAAMREQLRKIEEQQRVLLEFVTRLERRLDGGTATDVSTAGQLIVPPTTADASVPAANAALNFPQAVKNSASTSDASVPAPNAALNTPEAVKNSAGNSVQPASVSGKQSNEDRYRDGIILWQTPDDASVPFLLKFNNNTQLRFLNTVSSDHTFTDHLGVVREVHRRNDITVNRSMFILGGYIFDKRLLYSLTVWTSAGAASIVVAGNIGWRFNKAFSLTAGYTGVPGSRSLVATFPFFGGIDRSMADNFFRPGFTQGIWANGEPIKGLHYLGFVGNGLNTLNVSANKIDTNLLVAGSVWWEPLGDYGPPGKSRNMYDDYYSSKKTRIRIGTSFTRSREDRFSDLDQSNPDNTSLHNSDGVLTFSTGAFAPGVTVDNALYKMWAIDGGLKKNGLAINGQYFMRWLSNFQADGPLPLSSTFDQGGELSVSKFVVPKKWMLYGRMSGVLGQFRDSYEAGGGVRWYFLPTERLWFNAELMRVNHSPYGGAFTPYTPGLNGWVPMVQTVIAF
jgi:hypothetical protein